MNLVSTSPCRGDWKVLCSPWRELRAHSGAPLRVIRIAPIITQTCRGAPLCARSSRGNVDSRFRFIRSDRRRVGRREGSITWRQELLFEALALGASV
jgi:hypothetical protein